jgi:hypothetical protein
MTDLLHRSAEWLARQMQKHAGQEIHYRRGATVLQVRATIGRSELAVDDGQGGVVIEHTDRDFLIRAEDFFLNGRLTEPKSGDRIEEFTNQRTFVYEVLAPKGHPVWRYDDPYRQMIRIHTKLVEQR